ncbi:hypothetical protein [Clostridium grantii]|uniref:hypothetical protein n=1 Tax=Clostridium grantii TaxID=40575 RepID=UPI001A9A2F37|nr:hypothetical protein [Clostridium grantii]
MPSCNNAIVIPSFNIQKKLTSGENLIKFIPSDKDNNFSCLMGMISGVIKVTDNLDLITAESAAADVEEVPYESIYGPDLSIFLAEVLVKIALVENKKQSIEILGVQLELNPLIVVAEKGKELQIKFDAANGYAILLDNNIAGVIEIVDDINNVDVESIRNKYIPSN